ncbi:DnaJ domain-containing protein [bacterium]|nr:DnaJ domain-containing protein [candidate division CSSED10-310 bacterium]
MEERVATGRIDNRCCMADLFYQLYINRENGLLLMADQEQRIYFNLKDGDVIYARSNITGENLSGLLIQDGLATREQLSVIGKNLADITARDLVEMQMMRESEAVWWQKILIRDITLHAFRWTSGAYKFTSGRTLASCYLATPIDTWNLIEGSLQQINNLLLLQTFLGPLTAVPRVNQNIMRNITALPLKIRPQDGFILSRVDGSSTIKDIITMAGPNKIEAWKFLLLAKIVHLITFADTPEELQAESHSPLQLSKNELQDITLTAEEITILDSEASRRRAEETAAIDLNAEASYMRDGRYVEDGTVTSGALDVDNLRTSKAREEDHAGSAEDKIIYVIDGEEVDGEADLIFGKGKSSDKGAGTAGASKSGKVHKTIEEMWEEWISTDSQGPTGEDRLEEDFASRWQDWINLEEERERIEGKIIEITEEIESLPEKNKREEYYDRHEEQIKTLHTRLDELNKDKKLQVIYFYRRSTIKNYYEILGLNRTDSIEVINEAYYTLSQQFNPDRHKKEHLGQVWEMLKSLHERVLEAYSVLSEPAQRERYDRQLEEQDAAMKLSADRRGIIARKNYGFAEAALIKGDFKRGCEYLRAAISLNSKEPDYYVALAEALSANPKWYWEAMKNLNRAIKLEPTNPKFYFLIGKLFSRWGRITMARTAFNLALRFDPSYPNLKKELLLLDSKRNTSTRT